MRLRVRVVTRMQSLSLPTLVPYFPYRPPSRYVFQNLPGYTDWQGA